ncbi:lipopolysaccharide biosynthesis protein [Rhizobium sp. AAP43]|uniref:lipopolysaccharide biosynthesis protein n=1 Tax=Rhizobium sp. AAP43 TaxID=1523420 RepID=UPI0006B9115D|nr:lipopolysaccharide biosynthesis protein [Rhizobium sp. AAP43]KPF41896.1 exopolysaccharide biosynthesis protein [Rhizobium sp. AAP43]
MTGISHRIANASLWSVAGKLVARLIDFASLLCLARLLTPEDFGLVAIAVSILVIVETVLELPLTQALLRHEELTNDLIDTAFTLSLIRGGVMALLLVALAWPVGHFYDDPRLVPLIAVLAVAPAMRSVVSPRLVIFMRDFDFKREFVMDLAVKFASLIAAVGVAFATGSYWGLAIGAITGPILGGILSYVFAPMRPRLTLCEWHAFRDIIGWNSVAQVLMSFNWQLDRLLLPRFASLSALGAFSVSDSIAGIPHQVFVGPLLRPLIAGFTHVSDAGKRIEAYLKATHAIVLTAAPVLIILTVLAEPVLRLAVGDKWVFAAPIFQGLCIVSIITLPSAIMPPLAMVRDRTSLVALRMAIEFAVRIPVTIAAVIQFGLAGAIGARLVGVLVAYLTCILIVRHLIGLSLRRQVAVFAKALLPALPMALGLWWIEPNLAALPAGILLFVALSAASAGAMALFWLCALLLWILTDRPAGLEKIVIEKLRAGRQRFSVALEQGP